MEDLSYICIFHRISSKNPYLPPELEQQKEEEAKRKEEEDNEKQEKEKVAETTQDKINTLKEKMAYIHKSSPDMAKMRKQLEEMQIQRDGERIEEIQTELKDIPRYGPEAANLRAEQEEIETRQEKRKAAEEEAKVKSDKPKTNKARDGNKITGGKTMTDKTSKTTVINQQRWIKVLPRINILGKNWTTKN